MTTASVSPPASRLLFLPWLILFAMLGATWFVWDHERQNARKELHTQFDFALRDTVSRIEQRVAAYEQLLRGVQGLFATTGLRSRQAIHDYVEPLRGDPNLSGMQGLVEVDLQPGQNLLAVSQSGLQARGPLGRQRRRRRSGAVRAVRGR